MNESKTTLDLWGDEIDFDIVPPDEILRDQAEAIGVKTGGRVIAKVESGLMDGATIHTLLLQAPVPGYSEVILNLHHVENKPYPVQIILPVKIDWYLNSKSNNVYNSNLIQCDTQSEFIAHLGTALRSSPTKSTLANLLAMVNQHQRKKAQLATA